MHKRSLLVGIGIGIIIGVLLLELFNLGAKSQQQLSKMEQQMNDAASPSPVPTLDPSTVPETTPVPEPSPQQSSDLAPDSPDAPNEPEIDELEEQSVASPEAVVEPKVSYILRVHPGDPITKTAKQLKEQSVIDDADSFVSYLKEHDAQIRAGFFLVEQQSSMEELRKLFAGQPLTEAEANDHIATKGITLIQ